mgnify:CR=1 FL=1
MGNWTAMGLDDKFNSNDGSFIDIADSVLFEFNKKIATKWQDKTYRSKADLEKVLYLGSAVTLGYYVTSTGNFPMVLPGALSALKGLIETARPTSSKHAEILAEASGLPCKTPKYLDVALYGLGIIATAIGVGSLLSGIVSGNNEHYLNSINGLSLGLGTLGWVSADYMAKSDIGEPPKKPVKKSIFERINESIDRLLPDPLPEPSSVGVY